MPKIIERDPYHFFRTDAAPSFMQTPRRKTRRSKPVLQTLPIIDEAFDGEEAEFIEQFQRMTQAA